MASPSRTIQPGNETFCPRSIPPYALGGGRTYPPPSSPTQPSPPFVSSGINFTTIYLVSLLPGSGALVFPETTAGLPGPSNYVPGSGPWYERWQVDNQALNPIAFETTPPINAQTPKGTAYMTVY